MNNDYIFKTPLLVINVVEYTITGLLPSREYKFRLVGTHIDYAQNVPDLFIHPSSPYVYARTSGKVLHPYPFHILQTTRFKELRTLK